MEIPGGGQIFDLVFHPTFATVYTGLLTGHIKAFAYDDQGNHETVFTLRPSKRSCRGLSINEDGSQLYAVGKGKSLSVIDTETQDIDTRTHVHDSPINRVRSLMPGLVSTGDDNGVIKLWDPRQRDCLQTYKRHFDYITDFLWLDDKKQLVATSGDGTLSVMDIRSKKEEPIAYSEDQEDELLSIVAIKGDTKAVVGTQLGILSIFNRNKGWGDCVDRVPGQVKFSQIVPNVDAGSTILTGSSDGYVRAVQLYPTKLLGILTDHGDLPVERMAVGQGYGQLTIESKGVGRLSERKINHQSQDTDGYQAENDEDARIRGPCWVGSVGHEESVRMSNLEAFFGKEAEQEDSDDSDDGGESILRGFPENRKDDDHSNREIGIDVPGPDKVNDGEVAAHSYEPETPKAKKRKRKPEKDVPLRVKKKAAKNTVEVDGAFFSGL